MAKLVSMKMSKSEREEQSKPMMLGDAPIYPYGLQLRLDEEALDKLGETTLPAVGESVMVYAKAKVVSVSSNESTDGGKRRNVELQITDLCLEDPADDSAKSAALYGKEK
jgi:hypothetical protein